MINDNFSELEVKAWKVMAVVLSFNNPNELEKTVRALVEEVDLVYVVDNGSRIENANKIKRLQDQYHFEVCFLEKNFGIGKALNHAVSKAKRDNFHWLLTMDQDSVFQHGFMNAFYECALKTGARVLAANTQGESCQRSYSQTQLAITSGNLVNISIYDEVGIYNEWLFIDGVDFEFSLRLRTHSIPIFWVSDALLEHKLGDRDVKWCRRVHSFHSPLRRYYIFRNHFYLMKMFYKRFPGQISKMTVSRFGYVFTILLFGNRRMESLKYIFDGVLDFLKGITGKKRDSRF